MLDENKKKFFTTYQSTHIPNIDEDAAAKRDWFSSYATANYLPHIENHDRKAAKVLEIGCNKGFLLSALADLGFENLTGIDLSQEDIKVAQSKVPNATFLHADAFSYLEKHRNEFDIILLKAVLEHIDKDRIVDFITRIRAGLLAGGCAIIDVPNMDWLFAGHERYMDFTHEVGFTKESLFQVLSQVFISVKIRPVESMYEQTFVNLMKTRIARYILNKLFLWADHEGPISPLWARSLVAVATDDV